MFPILFHIGSITVYSYGFVAAVALAVIIVLAARWAPTAGLSASTALDALFVLFVTGIVGARLWYGVQHWTDFSGRWLNILWVQEGGLVWYGGFLSAFCCGLIFAKLKRLDFLVWGDFMAPLLALGHGIGRIGCYLNGCCFGYFLGMPTQLIESATLMVLSAVLYCFWRRSHFRGQILCLYGLLYSVARFLIEFIRQDQTRLYGLSLAQWTSLAILFISISIYIHLSRSKQQVLHK